MKIFSPIITALAFALPGFVLAQTASVQFIHNSGDALLSSVDVYVDDVLLIDNLDYRYASSYLDLAGNTDHNVAVAPSSSVSSSEAVANFTLSFTSDVLSCAVLNGLASASGYNPLVPLDIDVFSNSRISALNTSEVDLLFAHGSTDLPMVSLRLENQVDEWVSDLFFGQFNADYVSITEDNWLVDMLDVSNNVIDQYELPLGDLALAGSAVTAVFSGFNHPENNYLGEALAIWLALPEGGALLECPLYVPPQYTQAQFIHASADPSMQVVDVYLDDVLYLDDFSYLNASPFIDVEALNFVEMLIAPSTSLSSDEAFVSLPFYLNLESDYVITIHGNLENQGFSPVAPLQLNLFEGARTTTLAGASTNVLFVQASTDFPAVNIHESELLQLDFATDWQYGEHEGYFEILTADYVFGLNDPNTNLPWASFSLPLLSYALGTDAITVVACGYANTAANAQGSPFGMYAALYGGGPLIPLTATQALPTVEVQFLHNSADPLIEMVDVYLNGAKWIDDLMYHHASSFVTLPLFDEAMITVVPSDALTDESGFSWMMPWTAGERYVLTLNGLMDGSNFSPNLPLSLLVQSVASEPAPDGSTQFFMIHGSTDGPSYYTSLAADGSELVPSLAYNDASFGLITVSTQDFFIDLHVSNTDAFYQTFGWPLATWGMDGQTVALVAGGFHNPSLNGDGPEFGLWMATAQGGPMLPLPMQIIPTYQARAQFIHASADQQLASMDLYMDGVLIADNWSFRSATPFIDVPAEVDVLFALAPASSTGPEDAFVFIEKTFAADQINYAIVEGMINPIGYNPMQPIALSVLANAQEEAVNANQMDVVFYNGTTDSPGIDASELTVPMAGILDNLMFDGLGGFLSLDDASDYAFGFAINQGNGLGEYAWPVNQNNWGGEAALIFASGFLNPGNNNDGAPMAFYAVLSNGTTFPLSSYISVPEPTDEVLRLEVYPNPAINQLNMILELQEAKSIDIELIDINGKVVISERNLPCGLKTNRTLDVSHLSEGYYFLRIQNRQLVKTIGFGIIR